METIFVKNSQQIIKSYYIAFICNTTDAPMPFKHCHILHKYKDTE